MCWRKVRRTAVVAALLAMAAPASSFAGAPRATAPPGYVIVRSHFTAPPGMFDSGGQATCPTGTVVWGGGAGNDFSNGTINTSEFAGTTGWNARVNNNAGDAEGFEVDAICAKKPKLYKFVSHQVDDPAGAQVSGSATCPAGTVLLSGSVLSEGDTSNVYLTSAWPNNTQKFTAVQENKSTSDQPFTVLVLCAAKPAGYQIVRVTQTVSGGNGIVEPEPNCSSGKSVIGGGIQIAPRGPTVDMSGSYVGAGSTTAWIGVVQNTGTTSSNVTGSTICAA
jgi:hypothetical protein